MKLGDTLKRCKEFKANELRILLNQCTYEQEQKFYKIFGKDLAALDDYELNNAIRICESTIIKSLKNDVYK